MVVSIFYFAVAPDWVGVRKSGEKLPFHSYV